MKFKDGDIGAAMRQAYDQGYAAGRARGRREAIIAASPWRDACEATQVRGQVLVGYESGSRKTAICVGGSWVNGAGTLPRPKWVMEIPPLPNSAAPHVPAVRESLKPQWADAPCWARYLAQSRDGSWRWYEYKPRWTRGHGWSLGAAYGSAGAVMEGADMSATLEGRP